MGKLVLVRHGESRWNLSNRFTGWVDVPLSANGVREAERCAKHCAKYDYDAAFTSKLQRAQATLSIILTRQNRTGIFQHEDAGGRYRWLCDSNRCSLEDIPVYDSEALNERHYGILQGLDKAAAEEKYGTDKLLKWRRGYANRPPKGESLEEAHARMHPYLIKKILPRVRRGENVIVTAHGNTLRAVIKHLEKISDDAIAYIDLPQAKPLVYEYRNGGFVRIEGVYRLNRPLR